MRRWRHHRYDLGPVLDTHGPSRPAMPGEHSVRSVIRVVLLALIIGAVLTGDRLGAAARSLEYGPVRTLAVVAATPAEWLNHALFIDRARDGLRAVLLPLLEPDAALAERPPAGDADDDPPGQDAVAPEPPEPSAPATETAPPDAEVPTDAAPSAVRNPRPSPGDPLRVIISGDSMTEAFGKYLRAELIETGMVDAVHDFRYSSGLARPDFFDWPTHLEAALREQDPDVVVMMIGANDGQNMTVDGKPVSFGTDEWRAEYTRRVGRAMDIATGEGRRVYWVGLPIARPTSYAEKSRMLNEVYRAQAATRPGVVYIDTWSLFSGPDGVYSAYLKDASGATKLMRSEDGIHFSVAGAHHLTDHVMDVIGREHDLSGGPS